MSAEYFALLSSQFSSFHCIRQRYFANLVVVCLLDYFRFHFFLLLLHYCRIENSLNGIIMFAKCTLMSSWCHMHIELLSLWKCAQLNSTRWIADCFVSYSRISCKILQNAKCKDTACCFVNHAFSVIDHHSAESIQILNNINYLTQANRSLRFQHELYKYYR